MKVVILGSGNMAHALVGAIGRLSGRVGPTAVSGKDGAGGDRKSVLEKKDTEDGAAKAIELVQIYARSRQQGERLAAAAGVDYTASLDGLAVADLYIIAVSDGAVAEVAAGIPYAAVGQTAAIPHTAVIAHTAGSIGIDTLLPHANRAVVYPLQTFTKGRDVDFREIPVFIEYATPHARQIARDFAEQLSGQVWEIDSQKRAMIHLAAVFASNFPNHMYTVAGEILGKAGLPFDTVKPLIAETAAKALAVNFPSSVQTGPAVRGDRTTMERHLNLLDADGGGAKEQEAQLRKDIYETISRSIWETSKKR